MPLIFPSSIYAKGPTSDKPTSRVGGVCANAREVVMAVKIKLSKDDISIEVRVAVAG